MPSISNLMMAAGFGSIQAIHGESVLILTGPDAGKRYTGVILTQSVVSITDELGTDSREKVTCSFPISSCPALDMGGQIQDSSAQVWRVVNRVDNPADITTDFELIKIVTGKDQ